MQLRRVSLGEGAETEPAESVERQKAQSCRSEVEKVALGEVVHWPVVAPSTVLVHFPLSQPNSIYTAITNLLTEVSLAAQLCNSVSYTHPELQWR